MGRLILTLALSWACPALAQPTAPGSDAPAPAATDTAAAQAAEQEQTVRSMDDEARQHFQIARTLLEAGRFQQAAEEFQEAYRLSGRPELLYNLYIAHRDGGNLPAAIESLRSYLDKVPDAPDRINLRARLRTMEEQVAKQQEAEAAAQRAAEEAERAKAAPKTRTVVERSIVPWVIVGAGGALLASSVVTGVIANGKSNDLDEACTDGRCPASEQGNIDSAKTLAVTTDVLWGVGAATAITGLVLWWTGALDEERQVPVASIGVSEHGASAFVQARF